MKQVFALLMILAQVMRPSSAFVPSQHLARLRDEKVRALVAKTLLSSSKDDQDVRFCLDLLRRILTLVQFSSLTLSTLLSLKPYRAGLLLLLASLP